MGGKGNINSKDRTNGFDKNPQNINRKGAKKPFTKLRDMIKEMEQGNFEVKIPVSQVRIEGEYVIIKGTNRELLVNTLMKKAHTDPRWFDLMSKIVGEYAPTQINQTDEEGNPIKVTPESITVNLKFGELS